MLNMIFIVVLVLSLGILYSWAFRKLPLERWQILCAIPVRRQANGAWQGLNLTYYGIIIAGAVTFAMAVTFILLGSVGLSMETMVIIVGAILIPCVLSSKWIARLVEKKKNTFSVGGAAFCGLVGCPLFLLALQPVISSWWAIELPLTPFIAAMTIGYTFGEGIGRLACLSFGCCYGKPIDTLSTRLRRVAIPLSVVFHGENKKASYEGGLNGCRVLAVQAITTVLYTAAGILGVHLYLHGHFRGAYLFCIIITQTWRILSEFLRADFRGAGRISIYQYQAGIAAGAAVIYSIVFPETPIRADLMEGLRVIWDPVVILLCQCAWLGIFLFTGRSKVTAAHVSIFVHSDRI